MFPDPTEVMKRRESHSIPYMVRSGETVIVAGVWQPHTVVKYATVVGSTGRLVFIEPVLETMERLSIITADMPQVAWVNKALWRHKTKLKFTINDGDYPGWNRIVNKEISKFPERKVDSCTEIIVQADTLDNICRDLEIGSVDHVNLTINRAEFAALDGMTKVLEMNPEMRIYIATSLRRTPEMMRRLTGLGFAVLTAIPPDKPSRMGKPSTTRRIYGMRA